MVAEVLICDDNDKVVTHILNLVTASEQYKQRHFLIKTFQTGEELTNYLLNHDGYRVIFLDIELDKMSGMDVGEFIRKDLKDLLTEIVYISGKKDYSRQLFATQPLHFLSKPIQQAEVDHVLNLAAERNQRELAKFSYSKNQTQFLIYLDDILYFEAQRNYTRIITKDFEDRFQQSLKHVENTLNGHNNFLRIQRSFIVNIKHIRGKDNHSLIMQDGANLPFNKKVEKKLIELFFQ